MAAYMRRLVEVVFDLHRSQGIGLTRHIIDVAREKTGPPTLAFNMQIQGSMMFYTHGDIVGAAMLPGKGKRTMVGITMLGGPSF